MAPLSDGIEVVLLHGLGGSGKSTAAKIAYQAAYLNYGEGNVGNCRLDPAKQSDSDHLLSALLSMLSHLGMYPVQNASLDALHTRMARELAPRQRPVLLLVDDVYNSNVAEALLLLEPSATGFLVDLLPMG